MNNQKAMRPWFLRMLTDGDYVYTERELQAWAQKLGVTVREQGCFCIVAKMNITPASNDGELMPFRLLKACEKELSDLWLDGYACIGSHMDVVLMVTDWDGDLRQCMEALQQTLSRRMHENVRLGIGKTYQQLSKINFSKAEAYEALLSLDENVLVADIADIYKMRNISSTKAQSEKMAILEKFRFGKLGTLEKDLKELAETVRRESVVRQDAPYPTSIRRTMIELLVEITHIASDAGVDVDEKMEYTDPYSRIFEMRSTPEIIDWVLEISGSLHEEMQRRRSQMEISLIGKAKVYIQDNLSDPALSLGTVSEELGFSPAYFSNFFIKETGMGFKDYVNQSRLVLAVQLLKQQKLRIGEIAERCGFQSESYFIAFFKKYAEMTPGKFRKNIE